MSPARFYVNHWLLGLAISLGISLAAKCMDFPRIHVDDLYYIQTAATYKNEGRLDNAAFTDEFRQGLTPDRDFGQLPFYSYAMSKWMELFGLSGASLQAFFLFFCFWASLRLWIFLEYLVSPYLFPFLSQLFSP